METANIAIVFAIVGMLATFLTNLLTANRLDKIEKAKSNDENIVEIPKKLNMSFDEMNKIIDAVFEEISQNKYLIHYILKEIKVIPKMDEEIRNLTMDVLHAFSPEFRQTLYSVYSEDYVVKMLTRRSQKFMIEYLDKHKPRSK